MKADRKLNLWLLCAIVALGENVVAQQPWEKIVPLHTSRKQVERLLGRPTIVAGINTYYFDRERVEVYYAKSSCAQDRQGWKVPLNTVLSVHVVPKKPFPLAQLTLDHAKFRKGPGAFDNPSHSLLRNEEDGITLSVIDDVVDSYGYVPKAKDRFLRCPNYSAKEAQRMQDCMPATFALECDSEEISPNQSVACRMVFYGAEPTIQWTVSKDVSFKVEGSKSIRILIKNPNTRTVSVTGKIMTPNVCYRRASAQLRVVNLKRK